jgi:endoglycosylceramidase
MRRISHAVLLVLLSALLAPLSCAPGADGDGDAGVDTSNQADGLDADAGAGADVPSVFEDRRFLTDDQGRVLILHGVNFMGSAKGPPFLPPVEYAQADRIATDWGFNSVRYLIIWEGVEPEPGVYDEGYLDAVEAWMDYLHGLGIWVFLDMHQDLWARRYGGDGAPDWAVRHDDQPFTGQPRWFENYFQPAVKRCFDNFWAYDQGAHADLQDHYAAMWRHVAERFRDHPAVIGYDLMNEPHPGSDVDALELIGFPNPDSTHASFDRDKFHPFYTRVISAIREVDADTFIFFEPRYGAPGNGVASYLPPLTDPREGAPRLVYAPHLYSVKLEANEAYAPESDTAFVDWERERRAEVAASPMPIVIGEWGFGTDWENVEQAMIDTVEMADRLLAGWSYWPYDPGGWSFVDGDWNEKEAADWVVRVYPQRIAGAPTSFSYDRDTRVFELVFEDREGVTGPTEIYIPAARSYPDGWEITVSDAEGAWSTEWDAAREILRLTTPKTGGEHRVTIQPGP